MLPADSSSPSVPARKIDDLVFVGFNRQVAALDRYTGEIVWSWRAPSGTGFVSILLDGDRLIVAVQGYTYCLDPLFGQEVWRNTMKGFGVGITCLASLRGATHAGPPAATTAQQQAQAAATSASIPG